MRRVLGLLVVSVAGLLACQPEKVVEASLELSASPSKIKRDGSKTTIAFSATDEHGKPGTGDVYVESSAGTLIDGTTVTLDSTGIAGATFACDISKDPGCMVDGIALLATWKLSSMGNVHGSLNVPLLDLGSGGGGGSAGGGGTGAGGGSGGSGGSLQGGEPILVGEVDGTIPWSTGFAPLSNPSNVSIGMPVYSDAPRLTPAGEIVYEYSGGTPRSLRKIVFDHWAWSGGKAVWPPDVGANDFQLATPGCTGQGIIDFTIQSVTGSVYYRCNQLNWMGPSGDTGFPNSRDLWAVNSSGLMLGAYGGFVVFANGVETRVTGVPPPPYSNILIRAHADGFYLALTVPGGTPGLWSVGPNATATKVGDYATNLDGTVSVPRAIDGIGVGYAIAKANGNPAVVKYPMKPGTASVVFEQTKFTPNEYTRNPPAVTLNLNYSGILSPP
jgi:hypothetical protein